MKVKEAVYLNYRINEMKPTLNQIEKDISDGKYHEATLGVSETHVRLKAFQLALEALMEPAIKDEGLIK